MAASKRGKGALELKAKHVPFMREVVVPVQSFIHVEWVGSAVLLAAAIVALVWANSPWSASYFELIHVPLTLDIGILRIEQDVGHFVNDGFMAVFFFVVGLEMKREVLHGGLSSVRTATLPGVAAIGGMVVPAALYFVLNPTGPESSGWGVPMATDIAFALGVIGLVGKGIPPQLRLFLLALAIVDDLGAILVIAVFYTDAVSVSALLWAIGILAFIVGMRLAGIRSMVAFWVVGFFFWAAVLESGIHATVAGVIMGAITPARAVFSGREYLSHAKQLLGRIETAVDGGRHDHAESALGELELMTVETEAPLERLERLTHPWSAYVILPIFALVNAGVPISGQAIGNAVTSSVTLGVMLGLMVGKPVGVLAFSWLAVKMGIASLPERVRWSHIVGAGILAGVGFTMSIFIDGLAFENVDLVNEAKIGIVAASLTAGVVGYGFLRWVTRGDEVAS